MRVSFFAVPALDSEQAAHDLNTFLASHRILEIESELVSNGASSFWSVCVRYTEGAREEVRTPSRKRIDYREVLGEREFAVFARLRTLRKQLAEEEGVPLYALFTNDQLAAMARGEVDSLETLGSLEGVGPARVEKYGKAFLNVLRGTELSGNGADGQA